MRSAEVVAELLLALFSGDTTGEADLYSQPVLSNADPEQEPEIVRLEGETTAPTDTAGTDSSGDGDGGSNDWVAAVVSIVVVLVLLIALYCGYRWYLARKLRRRKSLMASAPIGMYHIEQIDESASGTDLYGAGAGGATQTAGDESASRGGSSVSDESESESASESETVTRV